MGIHYNDFKKVDIRVGSVLSVVINKKAHRPALVLKVNFGYLNFLKIMY